MKTNVGRKKTLDKPVFKVVLRKPCAIYLFSFFVFFKSGTYLIPKEHKILGHIDQTPAIPFSIALEASLIHSSQQNGMIPWFTISRLLFKP